MDNKKQTITSFKEKWSNNATLAFHETLKQGSSIQKWILERNGFKSLSEFQEWLLNRGRILDAGCGNGRVTALLQANCNKSQEIIGIDLSSSEIAVANLSNLENVVVYKKDLLGDLSEIGEFDLIYCQEVLHHTADPFAAFSNLCSRLNPCGEIAIYVYKVKAPIREYTDDYIRGLISNLSYKEIIEEMSSIADLGKMLSELNITINVPEIKSLEIAAGNYDIQRFIYHFFFKCFWNPNLTQEENAAVNYDWYHPTISTRHTLDEVKSWFDKNSLEIIHSNVDHYGITVRGKLT